jgi:iron complex transport system substrate-binding protein
MTRTLTDLGLGSQVVGRTPFCDSVGEDVPVVGSLLDVDYERLIAVNPTHLVIQPAAAGTDPELERLAAAHGWVLVEQGLDRLEDVEHFLSALAGVAKALPDAPHDEAGAALVTRCLDESERLRALRTQAPAAQAMSILLLVGNDPVTAAGTDTFVSQMLVAAGGRNAVTASGYPELSLEDVAKLNPEGIILFREKAPAESAAAVALQPFRESPTLAGRERRVAIHVDPFAMLPSTQATGVVGRLRELITSWSTVETKEANSPRKDAAS